MGNRQGNNFDFIRFVAAVLVIITHSQGLLGNGDCDALCEISRGTMQLSHLGVAVFFTISGYLIVKSYLSSDSVMAYLWRRFLRIFPALAVVMVLIVFVLGPCLTTLQLSDYFGNSYTYLPLLSISLYRLYLNLPGVFESNPHSAAVNGPLWTLAYEFSCYLLVVVAGLTGLLKKRLWLLIVFGLGLALRIYLGAKLTIYSYSTPYLLGLNIMYVFEWGMYFLAGALVYLYRDKINLNLYWFLALLVLLVVAIFVNEQYGRVVWMLFIPVMVFAFAFLQGPLNHFSKMGDFSYGIYIIGFPVQQTIIYLTGGKISTWQLFFYTMIILLPLAALSWHLIEKRALSYRNLVGGKDKAAGAVDLNHTKA